MTLQLQDPISKVPKTHGATLAKMQKLGINTIADMLSYYPKRYVDFSRVTNISDVFANDVVTVRGVVTASKNTYLRGGLTLQNVVLTDSTGSLKLVWFNQPYIVNMARVGVSFAAAGIVEGVGSRLQMKPQEYEVVHDDASTHTGRIVPVYSQRGGLSSRLLREKITYCIQNTDTNDFGDLLPHDVLQRYKIPHLATCISYLHNPQSLAQVDIAKARLNFENLFCLHIANLQTRSHWLTQSVTKRLRLTSASTQKLESFISTLPFELTDDQAKVFGEIREDLLADIPMNRFVQGDVGSGKTVVAALAAYMSALNGQSTIFMCPTLVLANQHAATLTRMFAESGISVELVTSDSKIKKLDLQTPKIVVGTHALLYLPSDFKKVSLIVIDEQHRFGVRHRARLKNKSGTPHVLTMTATPIPRTLALTVFGDLRVSVIQSMPKGRLPVKTYVVAEHKRQDAYAWIRSEIAHKGARVYVICPKIDLPDEELVGVAAKENMQDVKSAIAEAASLQKLFPDFTIGLLHGKLKNKEKEEVMQKFKNGTTQILVATTVVEVGVDVPEATIIIIEGAERFGLAQLHQLRGRVGRNSLQSYCLLFTTIPNIPEKLKFFSRTNSGAALADYDFKLRGPGSLLGTAQSGEGEFDPSLFADIELITNTQSAAAEFIKTHKLDDYPELQKKVESYTPREIAKD